MTTIAANLEAGVMACDSRVQVDDQWWPATKVHRVGDRLIGAAGDTGTISRFVKWFAAGQKFNKPKLPDDFCALVMGPDGLYYWASKLIPEPIDRGFHAIGSGGNAALGAMLHGASCEEAVRIACMVDTGSGGDVVVHTLKP